MFSAFIVDDDEYAAVATQMMFDWAKLNISKITKIYSADNLSEKILKEKPHVAFMDIEIGDVSGLDIIRECKENGSETHFIIISGYDNFDYARGAVNVGAIHYMLKPIDYSDVDLVSEKIKKLLMANQSSPKSEDISVTPIQYEDDWSKVQRFISENYGKKLSASDIYHETLINRTNFYKLFKKKYRKNFYRISYKFSFGKSKAIINIFFKTDRRYCR